MEEMRDGIVVVSGVVSGKGGLQVRFYLNNLAIACRILLFPLPPLQSLLIQDPSLPPDKTD